jgi:hypothetical protein
MVQKITDYLNQNQYVDPGYLHVSMESDCAQDAEFSSVPRMLESFSHNVT